jgi:enoyl-CoA hydratase/carnithine racemase
VNGRVACGAVRCRAQACVKAACVYGRYARYRIATERTVLAMPECAIGFFPDVGMTRELATLPSNLGVMMALTGYRLKGRDVAQAGLATHFVASHRLVYLERRLMEVLHFDEHTRTDAAITLALNDFADNEAWNKATDEYLMAEDR